MEVVFKDYKYKKNKIDIKLNSKNINGIIGSNIDEIEEIIKIDNYDNNVLIDKKQLKKDDITTMATNLHS